MENETTTPHPAKALIEARGLKLTWVAQKSEISYPTLTAKLRGEFSFTPAELSRLCEVLGVRPEELAA